MTPFSLNTPFAITVHSNKRVGRYEWKGLNIHWDILESVMEELKENNGFMEECEEIWRSVGCCKPKFFLFEEKFIPDKGTEKHGWLLVRELVKGKAGKCTCCADCVFQFGGSRIQNAHAICFLRKSQWCKRWRVA